MVLLGEGNVANQVRDQEREYPFRTSSASLMTRSGGRWARTTAQAAWDWGWHMQQLVQRRNHQRYKTRRRRLAVQRHAAAMTDACHRTPMNYLRCTGGHMTHSQRHEMAD
jgi:hypothetical protein